MGLNAIHLGVFIFLFGLAKAEAASPVEGQIEVIEKQTALACGSDGISGLGASNEAILDHLAAPQGSASRLTLELRRRALVVSSAIENPEESSAVLNLVENKRIAAKESLERLVAQLNQSEALRSPAAVTDSLREEVKKSYASYQILLVSDPRKEHADKISEIRKSGLEELQRIVKLSERIEKSMVKVNTCLCRTDFGSKFCKSIAVLNEEANWYQAFSARNSSGSKAFFGASKASTSVGAK